MVDRKNFDSDPSLRHRGLWNKVVKELGFDDVAWCQDHGKPHKIDTPKDLCVGESAKKRLVWDGTSPLETLTTGTSTSTFYGQFKTDIFEALG